MPLSHEADGCIGARSEQEAKCQDVLLFTSLFQLVPDLLDMILCPRGIVCGSEEEEEGDCQWGSVKAMVSFWTNVKMM